jgi:hypothetical protein
MLGFTRQVEEWGRGRVSKADHNDLESHSEVVRDSLGGKMLFSTSTVPALGSCE